MSILDWLFPRQCYFCGRRGAWICSHCWSQVKFNYPQKCPLCERGSYLGLSHTGCHPRWSLDGLFVFLEYRQPWRQMLHDYKYQLVRSLAPIWKEIIRRGLAANPAIVNFWRRQQVKIVPVPLYPARQLWRGFNQALILAQALAVNLNLPLLPNLLERRYWTRQQVKLIARQRRQNINSQTFALRKTLKLPPGNFLLVDDVVTTGSTLMAGASVLKKAGAGKVYATALFG